MDSKRYTLDDFTNVAGYWNCNHCGAHSRSLKTLVHYPICQRKEYEYNDPEDDDQNKPFKGAYKHGKV